MKTQKLCLALTLTLFSLAGAYPIESTTPKKTYPAVELSSEPDG